MAQSLGNAQELDGIYVSIGADLSGLKVGINETKQLAAQTQNQTAIRIPVIVDTSQARVAIQQLKIELAGLRALPGPTGGQLALPAPGGGSLGSVNGGGVYIGAGGNPAKWVNSTVIGNAGGGGGGIGGGGGSVNGATGGGMFSGLGAGDLRRALGPYRMLASAGFAARQVGLLGSAAMNAASINMTTDPEQQAQFAGNYESALDSASLGLRGPIRLAMANNPGVFKGAMSGVPGADFIVDRAARDQQDKLYAAQTMAAAARQDTQTQRIAERGKAAQSIVESSDLAHGSIGLSPSQVVIRSAQKALSDFDRQMGVEGGDTSRMGPVIQQARRDLQRNIADATRQDIAAAAAILRSAGSASTQIVGAANAGYIGATQGAVAGGQAALATQSASSIRAIDDQIQALRGQGVSNSDPRIQGLMQQRAAQQQANSLNAQTQQIVDTRDAGRAIAGSNAAVAIGGQVNNGDIVGAAEARVREQYRGSINGATDKYGAGSGVVAALKQEMEQAVVDAVHAAHVELSNRQLQYGDADTVGPNRGSLIPSTQRATRRASAQFLGNNETMAASITEMLGNMRTVLMNPKLNSTDRLDEERTQIAELNARKNQMLRPTQYADTGLGMYEAKGGPGGIAGKDVQDTLNSIDGYLSKLVEAVQNGGSLGN